MRVSLYSEIICDILVGKELLRLAHALNNIYMAARPLTAGDEAFRVKLKSHI